MIRRRSVAAFVSTLVLAVAACGDDAGSGDAGAQSADRDVAPETTTTTAAPTTTLPPPVIISAGDSILYDVSPALEAALHPDAARVIPLVAPSLAESGSATLRQRIIDEEADLVVVMVGVWEQDHRTSSGHAVGDPGFAEEYGREALDPLRDAVAAVGGEALLVGPPPLREPEAEARISALEAVWDDYAAGERAVDFVDAGPWLGEVTVFTELTEPAEPTDADGDGERTRLRRVDGVHLCEEGARRIAAGLIDDIRDRLAGPPRPGWQQGAWTARFPADECPPVT